MHRKLAVCLISISWLTLNVQTVNGTFANPSPSAPATDSQPDTEATVKRWFSEYDEIRRDAELTIGEKFACRTILSRGLDRESKQENNSAVSRKVESKYAGAVAAMQKLEPVAETTALQDGYAQFFTKAHHLISECLEPHGFSNEQQSDFVAERKSLEELDRKNKLIDAELRKKFKIPKHQHI